MNTTPPTETPTDVPPGAAPTEPSVAPAASAASALAAGAEPPKPLHESIPEKFRVFGENNEFNLEASASKLLDSYSALEKKIRPGALEELPESPDKYEIDTTAFGEGFNAEEFMADEANKGFLAKAHAHGMTNKQVQMVMEHALKEFAPTLAQGTAELTAETAIQSLKTEAWKTDVEFKQNMSAANRAFTSLPDGLRESVDKALGNNPEFIKVMALFGREMAEDRPPTEVSLAAQSSVEELMLSEAYQNERHPQHAKVSAQVREHFAKKYAGKVA